MARLIGVSIGRNKRIYFFDEGNNTLKIGDNVIVETKMGQEFGTVKTATREIPDENIKQPLYKIVKKANEEDKKHQEKNEEEEKKAFDICKKKIAEHKLPMNLVEAKYLFDNSKLIFYFTADKRIDFRDLVKDLASIFRTRIELRQIIVRDEVKRLCGNGMCGRELCCASFLKKYDGVTIKMAKEQNLTLNASKITGACGRLMCCLKYEQNVYDEKMKRLPHPGAIVSTPEGKGSVESVETLREIVKVKLKDNNGEDFYRKYPAEDIKIIKDKKRESNNSNVNNETSSDEDIKELEKLEQMDKNDIKNSSDDNL